MKDYSVLNGMIENQKSELRTAYDKGYNQGVKDFDLILATRKKEEEGYNRGLEDAWACCKRFLNSDDKVCDKIFGVSGWADFLDQSPSDAIEKFKEYDSKHYDMPESMRMDIEVGDLLFNQLNNEYCVATTIPNKYGLVTVMKSNGSIYICNEDKLKKTEVHYKDFADTLKELKDYNE